MEAPCSRRWRGARRRCGGRDAEVAVEVQVEGRVQEDRNEARPLRRLLGLGPPPVPLSLETWLAMTLTTVQPRSSRWRSAPGIPRPRRRGGGPRGGWSGTRRGRLGRPLGLCRPVLRPRTGGRNQVHDGVAHRRAVPDPLPLRSATGAGGVGREHRAAGRGRGCRTDGDALVEAGARNAAGWYVPPHGRGLRPSRWRCRCGPTPSTGVPSTGTS